MILDIHNFDGMPPPPGASEPMRLTLVRRFGRSPDVSEYWLATPDAAFPYRTRDGREVTVTHVVAGPGWIGQNFAPGFRGRVNLAYVTDESLIHAEAIAFAKADYVAYGDGTVSE